MSERMFSPNKTKEKVPTDESKFDFNSDTIEKEMMRLKDLSQLSKDSEIKESHNLSSRRPSGLASPNFSINTRTNLQSP